MTIQTLDDEAEEANMAENKYEGVPAPYGDKSGPDTPVGTSGEYLDQQLEAHGEPETVEDRQSRLEQEHNEREQERREAEQQREADARDEHHEGPTH